MKNQQEYDSYWESGSTDRDRDQDRDNRWSQRNTYSRQDDDWQRGQNLHMGGGYTGYAGNMNYGGSNDYTSQQDRGRGISSSNYAYRRNLDWNRGMSNQYPDSRQSRYNRQENESYNDRYGTHRGAYGSMSSGNPQDYRDYRNPDSSDWQNSSSSDWRNSNAEPFRGGNRYSSSYTGRDEDRHSRFDRTNQYRNPNDWNRSGYNRWNDDNDRGFIDRAGDEVRSWFGDDEAERRRRMDEQQERYRRNTSDRDWM